MVCVGNPHVRLNFLHSNHSGLILEHGPEVSCISATSCHLPECTHNTNLICVFTYSVSSCAVLDMYRIPVTLLIP